MKSVIILRNENDMAADLLCKQGIGVVPFSYGEGTKANKDWFRSVAEVNYDLGPLSKLSCLGQRIILSQDWHKELRRPKTINTRIWRKGNVEEEKHGWTILRFGECPETSPVVEDLLKNKPKHSPLGVAELYLADNHLEPSTLSLIEKAWRDILGKPYIPYDLTKRRRLFSRAYTELEPYIKAHEELKLLRDRKQKGTKQNHNGGGRGQCEPRRGLRSRVSIGVQ